MRVEIMSLIRMGKHHKRECTSRVAEEFMIYELISETEGKSFAEVNGQSLKLTNHYDSKLKVPSTEN